MPVLFGTYSWNFDSWFYSEKQYLPHITELYEKYGDYLVDPKPQLPAIAAILQDLSDREKALFVNGNTHFEGSVPRTIERLQGLLSGWGIPYLINNFSN